MRFRNSRLRTKIAALLLSMVALWAFAAWVTLREGVNLLWVSTVNTGVAEPIDALQPELQAERRLSLIVLGDHGSQQRAALDAQRIRTDKAVARFKKLAHGGSVKLAESAALKQAIDGAVIRFNVLTEYRGSIDAGLIDRGRAAAMYTDAIDSIFQMDDSLATLDDKQFAKDVQTLVQLNRAREVLSQEDALLSGALAAKRFSAADYLQFAQVVGARRYTLGKAVEELQAADHIAYDLVTKSDTLARLNTFEELALTKGKPDKAPPVTDEQWRAVADPALSQLSQAVFGGGGRMIKRAEPIALSVIARLVLAGGLGLLAVIASIIVSITTTRALMLQLERLRNAARELAEQRLPRVVERLGHGEQVDVNAEAPPLEFGADEIGQVGQAFNLVQETAIRTAVEQAELRRGIRDILLSLARRSQALVHRQLTLLDTMERREQDTTELEDLFRIDHLATRMRRNAENLIVLSGSTPARGWRRPVPMMDVVRSAVAEVEDYTRVQVMPIGEVALTGRAVGDIAHLLAELIENAVSFSPPYTQAQISGHLVASGYAIEIEDRGLGMTDENLTLINERISDPPEFNLSSSVQLGLYVVGRLAERYGVRVSLKPSPYGGTTAVVLIPRELVVEDAGAEAPDAGVRDADPRDASLPVAVGAPVVQARVGQENSPVPAMGQVAAEPSAPVAIREPAPPAPAQASAADPAGAGGWPAPSVTSPMALPGPGEPAVSTGGTEPAAEPPASYTPSGLPFRVPQASLAPSLRTDKPSAAEEEPEADDTKRSPEEIRKIVGAFQTGTRRGRTDAAKSLAPTDDDQ